MLSKEELQWLKFSDPIRIEPGVRKLIAEVERLQAEVKKLNTTDTYKDYLEMIADQNERIRELQAENEQLKKKNNSLELEITRYDDAEASEFAALCKLGHIEIENGRLHTENEKLQAKEAEAIEVLRFYRDVNYESDWPDGCECPPKASEAEIDGGDKANDLLKKWGVEL